MNIGILRKHWEGTSGGQIIINKDDLSGQEFDMIPPIDFRDEEGTKEWAELMIQTVTGMGYNCKIIKIFQN